jgi:hypothetical protein
MSGKPNDTFSHHADPGPRRSSSRGLYRSYLLRLWSKQEDGDGGTWRASLESPITQEQSHFPDLESLFAFLRLETGSTPALATGPVPAPSDMGGAE